MKETFAQYTAYNHWANKKLLDFTCSLAPEIVEKDLSSSFRSVNKTLLHIWDAELLWLSRIQGKPMAFWPSQQPIVDIDFDGLLTVSESWKKFIENKDSAFLNQECFFKTIAGNDETQKIHVILMHCMNHSTYHRGQIITMLRESGITVGIPGTDLLDFYRVMNSL
jgi:uncharacterized damage-inducible protein DinB